MSHVQSREQDPGLKKLAAQLQSKKRDKESKKGIEPKSSTVQEGKKGVESKTVSVDKGENEIDPKATSVEEHKNVRGAMETDEVRGSVVFDL